MKKTLAVLLTLALVISLLAACSGSSGSSTTAATTAAATTAAATTAAGTTAEATTAPAASADTLTISCMFSNHDSQPYTEETWLLPKAAAEKFNITMEMNAIPSASFEEKRNTTLASGDIPDLIVGIAKDVADQYGQLGMFMNFMNYTDSMPNMLSAMEKYDLIKVYMPSDTELYAQPAQITTSGSVSTSAYFIPMIRMDVLKELNLSTPNTYDEFYDVLAAIKAAYPESYPWVNRQSFDMILSVFAPGLGLDCFPSGICGTNHAVWNKESETFTSVFDEDNFRFFVEFLNKLYNDGLLDPTYASDDTSTWESKIVSGAGFFAVDYFARPDMMSSIATAGGDSDYSLEAMLIPTVEGGTQSVFARLGIGSWIVADAKTEDPARLCEFIDWWRYTEEGSLLTTYGVEGETYTKNADGTLTKIFTDSITNTLDFDAAYGTNYLQFWSFRPDFYGYNLYDASASYWTNQVWNLVADRQIDSPPTIVRNAEEIEEYNDVCVDMLSTIRNVVNEFIMGRRDFATWDDAVKEINDAGYAFNLEQLNSVYARLYK
ncbi:MAG: hypothetical protein SO063_05925 [Eubacteriales bacterium]|nr:hypothetical protein [Eubacteriales bacterium]